MAKATPTFYWDACCWIGLIEGEGAKVTELRHIWERARKGDCQLNTSAYAYLEVRKKTTDPLDAAESDKQVDEMLDQPFVETIQVDDIIGRLARRLRRLHPELSRPDAIHVATAAQMNVDAMHTYDGSTPGGAKRLLALNEQVPRRDGQMLRITLPDVDAYGPLWSGAKDIRDVKEKR